MRQITASHMMIQARINEPKCLSLWFDCLESFLSEHVQGLHQSTKKGLCVYPRDQSIDQLLAQWDLQIQHNQFCEPPSIFCMDAKVSWLWPLQSQSVTIRKETANWSGMAAIGMFFTFNPEIACSPSGLLRIVDMGMTAQGYLDLYWTTQFHSHWEISNWGDQINGHNWREM